MGNACHEGLLRAVYLVIEPDPLLRMDLAETLTYRNSQVSVIAESSVEVALAQLHAVDRIKLALIAASPRKFGGSDLAQVIRQKGGQVVLMGNLAEIFGEAQGYTVLHRPFSQEQVLALIGELHCRATGPIMTARVKLS